MGCTPFIFLLERFWEEINPLGDFFPEHIVHLVRCGGGTRDLGILVTKEIPELEPG
jgi:hypothetical protein